MRNLLYLITFITIAPIAIATSLLTYKVISNNKTLTSKNQIISAFNIPVSESKIYAAAQSSTGDVQAVATAADARPEIIRQYLEKYDSPLLPYAHVLVDAAIKYHLDFRLLVAIAQQESNLCKKIPEDSYNCWGWGIHSKGTLRFDNYFQAIDTVSKGLRDDYLNKGYLTPEEIMKKYTPKSPGGSWAAGVEQFLNEMN